MSEWVYRILIGLAISIAIVSFVGVIITSSGPDHAERICVGLPTGDHLWIVDRGVIHRVPEWMQQRYSLEAQAPGPCPLAGSPAP